MYLFNPTYFIYMLPANLLMMAVQYYVRSAYQKWSRVPARSRLSGAQAAQRLIQRGGLYQVSVEGVPGKLTDHYDPRTKILRLSQGVYQSSSVASLAIAAHELGHAFIGANKKGLERTPMRSTPKIYSLDRWPHKKGRVESPCLGCTV